MAKFGQFSRFVLKKCIWVIGVILPPAYCLLLIACSPQKTVGRTTMECVEFQEDKGAVILPHILISPQI